MARLLFYLSEIGEASTTIDGVRRSAEETAPPFLEENRRFSLVVCRGLNSVEERRRTHYFYVRS